MGRLLLAGLLTATPWLVVQGQGFPSSSSSPPRGAGGNPFSSSRNDRLGTDTTGTDSFYNQAPAIPRETRWVNPGQLFRHQSYRPLAGPSLEGAYTWDPLQRVSGFVQSLGQIAKPYQVWVDGMPERYADRRLWRDEVMGRYDRNIVGGLQGVRYYDTRTPYVMVSYAQGPDKLLLTDVTASQNISPSRNMSLKVKRHLAEGA